MTDASWDKGLTAGGPTDLNVEITACPATGAAVGYLDFLDVNGNRLTGTDCTDTNLASWAYIRQWKIVDAPWGVADLKQISVAVHAPAAVRTNATPPIVMLTVLKSNR